MQILLALLFLFAGATKFIMPADEMAKNMPPYLSISFIGSALTVFGAILWIDAHKWQGRAGLGINNNANGVGVRYRFR